MPWLSAVWAADRHDKENINKQKVVSDGDLKAPLSKCTLDLLPIYPYARGMCPTTKYLLRILRKKSLAWVAYADRKTFQQSCGEM